MTKAMVNGNLTFRAEVKANYKPAIVDSFMDDSGEKILVLDNGRETTETRYNALWNPCKVFPKPDFKKLVEEGSLSEDGAILLNFLYEKIPAKPHSNIV